MKEIKFTCNVITPMFMAGADGTTPELRPSEFKGMMRFWWRAVMAEDNITTLREKETKLFGGTEKEGKSAVKIRILNENLNRDDYPYLPHSETKRFRFEAIREGSYFEVILTSSANITFYKNLFLLSIALGGFGKRARRGFGSIEVNGFSATLDNIFSLIRQIKDTYEFKGSKIINKAKGGDYPWIKEIEIGKSFKNISEVLITIGRSSHMFKNASLGSASPRMASPIYVSVVKHNNSYKPIITTLNSSFPRNSLNLNISKQEDFKRSLL